MADTYQILKEKLEQSIQTNNDLKSQNKKDDSKIKKLKTEIHILEIQVDKLNKTNVYQTAVISILQNRIRDIDPMVDLTKYTKEHLQEMQTEGGLSVQEEQYLNDLESAQ